MSKRKPPLDEKALAFFRRTGRKGGKRRLETMTAEERSEAAKRAGMVGGRPRRVNREKVMALRAAGKTLQEIARAARCSVATVSRILARGGAMVAAVASGTVAAAAMRDFWRLLRGPGA